MVLVDAAEPPRLAAAGAERWTKRKVVINGADPCASVVRTDDVRARHAGGMGLSVGCDVMARPWCTVYRVLGVLHAALAS
jgi:hypothetical protein